MILRPLNSTPLNSTRRTWTGEGHGAGSLYGGFSCAAVGAASVRYANYTATGQGAANLFNSLAGSGSGAASVYGSFAAVAAGLHGISVGSFLLYGGGRFTLGYDFITCGAVGGYELAGYSSLTAVATGGFRYYQPGITCEAPGLFRVANAWPEFELYRGIDGAEIDFSADPWATFDTLPATTPALDPGHAYSFVLRRRNAYGLASQNVEAWEITVDPAGDLDAVAPSAPSFTVAASTGGKILITGTYAYSEDGDDQADGWAVYLTTDGTDPDPETDTAEAVAMVKADDLAGLSYTTDAQTEGVEVRVLVRVVRAADGVESENTTIKSALATLEGPAAPVGGVYF